MSDCVIGIHKVLLTCTSVLVENDHLIVSACRVSVVFLFLASNNGLQWFFVV